MSTTQKAAVMKNIEKSIKDAYKLHLGINAKGSKIGVLDVHHPDYSKPFSFKNLDRTIYSIQGGVQSDRSVGISNIAYPGDMIAVSFTKGVFVPANEFIIGSKSVYPTTITRHFQPKSSIAEHFLAKTEAESKEPRATNITRLDEDELESLVIKFLLEDVAIPNGVKAI